MPDLLCGLGITVEDFGLYMDTFVREREQQRYWSKRLRWRYEKAVLEDRDILRHLAGFRTIGLGWQFSVPFLLLDFDVKHGRKRSDAVSLVREVTGGLPGEWLMVQSSESGGIHAYGFLDGPIRQWQAQHYLKSELQRLGHPHVPGVIESRMDNGCTRLPFGVGSMLLDPATLDTLDHLTLAETITFAHRHRQNCTLSAKAIQLWCSENRIIPKGDGQYYEIVNRLLDHGLSADIPTWEALWRLSWYLQARQQQTRAAAAAWLKQWIRRSHNGHSHRINSHRIAEVDHEIDDIVWRFAPEKMKRKTLAAPFQPNAPQDLSEDDLRRLLALHLPFPDLRDTVKVLGYAKANMRLHGPKTLYSNVSLKQRRRAGLTYVAQNPREVRDLFVPLPWTRLRQVGIRDSGRTLRRMCESGLLERKRGAHPESRHCAEYWVRFPFAPDTGAEIECLEAGIVRVLGPKGVRQEFKRDKAERILHVAAEWEQKKGIAYCAIRTYSESRTEAQANDQSEAANGATGGNRPVHSKDGSGAGRGKRVQATDLLHPRRDGAAA